MLEAFLSYSFLQKALLASIFSAFLFGVIGVIIVEKKYVMMAGGIAHTAYGGIGLGFLLGFQPVYGAFLFALLAAFGIGSLSRRGGAHTDVVIGLFWSLGMALGTIFIALMPGYPPDIESYLFGNILNITATDVRLVAILAAVVLLLVVVFFESWKLFLFDEEFCAIIGMPIHFMEHLMFVIIALSVVVLINLVGIILVMALFTAPAAVAAFYTRRLKYRMALAVALSLAFALIGLGISYKASLPAAGTIVMVAVLAYVISYVLAKWRRKGRAV